MQPLTHVHDAIERVEAYEGDPEQFELPISECCSTRPAFTCLITDHVLKRGWLPDGYEQRSGYRVDKSRVRGQEQGQASASRRSNPDVPRCRRNARESHGELYHQVQRRGLTSSDHVPAPRPFTCGKGQTLLPSLERSYVISWKLCCRASASRLFTSIRSRPA